MLIIQPVYIFYKHCLANDIYCNLEHSMKVSFDSVRIHFLSFLPEITFIFNLSFYAVDIVLSNSESYSRSRVLFDEFQKFSSLSLYSKKTRAMVLRQFNLQNPPCIINIEFVNVLTFLEIDKSHSFEDRIAQLQIIL